MATRTKATVVGDVGADRSFGSVSKPLKVNAAISIAAGIVSLPWP